MLHVVKDFFPDIATFVISKPQCGVLQSWWRAFLQQVKRLWRLLMSKTARWRLLCCEMVGTLRRHFALRSSCLGWPFPPAIHPLQMKCRRVGWPAMVTTLKVFKLQTNGKFDLLRMGVLRWLFCKTDLPFRMWSTLVAGIDVVRMMFSSFQAPRCLLWPPALCAGCLSTSSVASGVLVTFSTKLKVMRSGDAFMSSVFPSTFAWPKNFLIWRRTRTSCGGKIGFCLAKSLALVAGLLVRLGQPPDFFLEVLTRLEVSTCHGVCQLSILEHITSWRLGRNWFGFWSNYWWSRLLVASWASWSIQRSRGGLLTKNLAPFGVWMWCWSSASWSAFRSLRLTSAFGVAKLGSRPLSFSFGCSRCTVTSFHGASMDGATILGSMWHFKDAISLEIFGQPLPKSIRWS